MLHKKYKAFTLVELIVVVTILAILATIGFVSYSSYLTGVRDTNRIAQMTSLSDGLNLYSTRNDLPIPEDNIEILTGTDLISYQGYAGANILETINFDKGGLDPRDNTYFSYYLTRDRKYFQLMGFLEESADLTTQNTFSNHVNAVNYQDRIPTITGKKLGILTDILNNPIQDDGTDIDLGSVGDTYIARFSNDSKIEGTGPSLLSAAAVNHESFLQYDDSLELYLDFENNSVDDSSKNKIEGELVGAAQLEEVKGENALKSPIATSDYLNLGNTARLSSGLTDFSISVWTKLDVDLMDGVSSTNYHILGNETYPNMGFETRIEHSPDVSLSAGVSFRTSWGSPGSTKASGGTYPNDNKWHYLTFVKNGTEGKIYIDGKEANSYSTLQPMQNYAASTNNFTVGAYRPGSSQQFSGYIDDVRIYSRAIGIEEIENIYKKEKKVD